MAHNRYYGNDNDFDIVADSSLNIEPYTDIFSLPIETPPPPIFYENFLSHTNDNSPPAIVQQENGHDDVNFNTVHTAATFVNDKKPTNGGSYNCSYYMPSHVEYGRQQHATGHFGTRVFKKSPDSSQRVTPNGHQPLWVNLTIVDQPVDRCRFRYKAEQGPHGALRAISSASTANKANNQKSVPKVKIENYVGHGFVVASLWTNEPIPRPHVNELWGSECENGICRAKIDTTTMTASFPNLGIMRQKEKEICELLTRKYIRNHEAAGAPMNDDIKEKCEAKAQRETATMKDCLHCVRLGFQAFAEDPNTGHHIASPMVFSNPIYNSQNPGFSELRIAEIDKTSGTCVGGDVVWMRCATKVKRDQVKVKFCDLTNWESDAVFSPNDVYEQILIIFKTPPYHNLNINTRTIVHIRLFRPSDGEYSPPIEFVYLPVENALPVKRVRKLVDVHGSADPANPSQWPAYHGAPQGPQHSGWNDGQMYPQNQGYYQQGHGQHYKMATKDDDAMLPDHPMTTNRKRQSSSPNPTGSTNSKFRSLDSGIEVLKSMDTLTTVDPGPKSPGHNLSSQIRGLSLLEETNEDLVQNNNTKLEEILDKEFEALWSFCTTGDLTGLVDANKELISKQDDNGNTVLHVCARNKQAFAMKTLLKVLDGSPAYASIINTQNVKGQTPLHLAVKYGDADSVHYLLQAGANVALMDSIGNTVAHCMTDTFNEAVYREILFPPKVHCPQDSWLNANELNNDGFSALHLAIKKLRLNLVENLLEAKIDANVQERSSGKTALHLAVEVDDLDILNALLAYEGISVDKESYDGTTPLQLAVICKKSHDIITSLLNAGAKGNAKTSCYQRPSFNDDSSSDESIDM